MERTTFCCTRHSSVHSIHKGTRARRHVWHSQNGIRAAGSDKSTDRKFRTVGTVLQKSQRRCTRACAGIKEVITDLRIPVTVITGFLGSGKTTLLNHVLTNEQGKRIAVIENEFGEIDIDSSLVSHQETLGETGDTIMVLNNGCLCCTVREDLIKSLNELYNRRNEFDHIIIETTGLANPAPIISTFHLDPTLTEKVKLDGVVTVVDAKHVQLHLNKDSDKSDGNEALEQIAYADRIVLNKIDLVEEDDLTALENRLVGINKIASILRGQQAVVPVDYVLGVGGFDLDQIEGQVANSIKVDQRTNNVDHEHEHHEHEHHEHSHAHDAHAHDHHHDDEVQSVSLEFEGNMDLDKVNYFLEALMQVRGDDLYRMKGVLSMEGFDRRFVFQGVHTLFDGSPDRKWQEQEKRSSKIVFIGKGLVREDFEDALQSCLV